MKKRILSMVLVLCMVLSVVPLTPIAVVADGGEVTTAEALIAAVADGGTVRLGDSITLDSTLNVTKDLTLDLNGHTLTANKGINAKNVNEVTLIINDSSATGSSVGSGKLIATGLSDKPDAHYHSEYGIYVYGRLTVNSGTVEATGNNIDFVEGPNTDMSYGIAVYGILTVNGGSVTGTGGTVHSGDTGASQGIYAKHISFTGGSVTGNGGTVSTYGGESVGIWVDMGSLTVTGGTITGTCQSTELSMAIHVNQVPSLSISGGIFNGVLYAFPYAKGFSSSLSGGTFNDGISIIDAYGDSSKYLDSLLADGCRYKVSGSLTDGASVKTLGGSGTPVTVTRLPVYDWYSADATEYTISTVAELLGFANLVNGADGQTATKFEGKTVKLLNDLDLSGIDWTPVNGFRGTFDGQGKTISNLNAYGGGLFSSLLRATVQNLAVSGSVSGSGDIGGIVSAPVASTIKNCSFSGSVTGGNNYVGGIAGLMLGNLIENCSVSGSVTGSGENCRVGGIAGMSGSGLISKCRNTATISGSGSAQALGGIVGGLSTDAKIWYCYNQGKIINYGRYVGGLIGHLCVDSNIPLRSCYTTCDVNGTEGSGEGTAIGYAAVCDPITVSGIYVPVPANEYTMWVGKIDDSGILPAIIGEGESKSADAFASGEVAWLLQDAADDADGQVWGQTIGTDTYPVFADESGSNTVYKVTLKADGADDQVKYLNTGAFSISEPTAPTGFVFGGWYTAATGGTKVTAISSDLCDTRDGADANSITLYAKWVCAGEHTGGTADCTHKAVCTSCGDEYGEVNTDNHDFTAQVKSDDTLVSDATCKDEALYYYTCSRCGEIEKSDTHTFKGELDPNAHTGILSDWQMDDGKHWKVYTCCTDVVEAESTHDYVDGKCECGAVRYTITFNADGGNVDTASATTDIWGKLNTLPTPTRSADYRFDGWYTAKAGAIEVSGSTVFEADTTLYARWTDIVEPTGEIKLGTNSWRTFLDNITFDLFFNDTQEVEITATDNSGEDVVIEYLLSDKELTETDLATATFNDYTGKFTVEPNNEYVIYAKLTDNAGNVTYINSDGIVLDNIAPVISGIEDGKTYCAAQTVTVSDKYELTVTVNGNSVTPDTNGQFTLSVAEGEQKIVVTDKVGNQTEMTVTVNDGHTGGTADCTHKAKCEVCGDEYGEVNANNHDFTVEVKNADTLVSDATCKDEAVYYYTCSRCGEIEKSDTHTFEGELDSSNHTDEKEWSTKNETQHEQTWKCCGAVLVALEDHEWKDGVCEECGYECTHTGGTTTCKKQAECEVCGEEYGEVSANKHATLKHIEAKAATTEAEGNIEYWHCEDCGKYFSDKDGKNEISLAGTIIAKLEKSKSERKSPQTGDNSYMTLWFALLFVSGGALAGTTIYGKKKKHYVK